MKKPSGISPKNLVRPFTFEAPAWLRRIPLWLIALVLVSLPMLANIIELWRQLPMPYGKLFGPDDPDPWLRLSLVRDWLTGGSWYDHVVARSNAPEGGISTPWTRPLDLVIALLVKLQLNSASLDVMLLRAALLMPWLWMLLLMGGLFRAMRTLRAAPVSVLLVVALIGTMPVVWNYFGLGNADHHALLCALWVWALCPLLARPEENSPVWLSGLLLALMLWISPEALALIGTLYIFHGLAWLLGHPVARRLPVLTSVTLLGTLAALMIERPPAQWLAPIYDSISIVYVAMLALAALLAWALHFSAPSLRGMPARIAAALLGTAIAGWIFWSLYPLMLHGPLAEVDPYIFSDFLPRITEASPLFDERTLFIAAMLIQPILAVIICTVQLRRGKGIYDISTAALLAFLVIATLALYMGQQRWFYYFYPVVVIALAPWLAALFTPHDKAVANVPPASILNRMSEEQQLLRRTPVLLLTFIAPLICIMLLPNSATPTSRRIDACLKQARILIEGGQLNFGERRLTFLAPTDLGGEMLFWTPHRIVASNYHREGKGIRYAWQSLEVTTPQDLRRYLAARKVDALLICPDSRLPKNSLLLGLQAGTRKPPNWLKPVPLPMEASTPPDAWPAIFLVKH